MAKDYEQLASDIITNVGGPENVASLIHCATRLRFQLKDETKADKDAIKSLKGVATVIEAGGQFQVVIGTDVGDVYEKITDTYTFSESTGKAAKAVNKDDLSLKKKSNLLNSVC